MSDLDRVRWRCRRGMLELDLVLKEFMEKYYRQLSVPETETFKEMLNCPDNELWDLIMARAVPENQSWNNVLNLLRTS